MDNGDLLVMDGLTQSEYVHCTVSGLQGHRVNLTFRWVAQHMASCPLAGAVGCVLPSCVQGLAEPGPRGEWSGENKWSSSWSLVLLLLILVSVLLIGTLINIRRGHRQWSASILLGGALPLSGRRPAGLGNGVGHCHDVAKLPRVCLFISLLYLFGGICCTLFSRV